MISTLPLLVLMLFGGHAVADYGMQSAYMAENKVETPQNRDWFVTLTAHCLIHAFLVASLALGYALLTGATARHAVCAATSLGWAEFGAHFAIDRAKGQGRFSYRTDQALHYGCKLLWISLLPMLLAA